MGKGILHDVMGVSPYLELYLADLIQDELGETSGVIGVYVLE